MGDIHRFQVFADFIGRNFKPCRVADVAGGTGLLSYFLSQNGFDCSVIDPRPSDLPQKYRHLIRRSSFNIKRVKAYFSEKMVDDFDLVVGLHPDQATEPICHSPLHNKPCVVVPCCNFWKGIESHGSKDLSDIISKFFNKNHIQYITTLLPISGKNQVFVGRP